MVSEVKLIRLTMLSTALCLVCSIAFALTKTIPWFQKSGIFRHVPSEVGKKYALEMAPGKRMSEIARPVIVLTRLAALHFLWKIHDGKRRIFRNSFYRAFIASMVATTFWVFLFDRERHLDCLVIVGCVYVTSYFTLLGSCERVHVKADQLTGTGLDMLPGHSISAWKFRFFIVTSSIFQCIWVTMVMGSTVAFPLAYAHSSHVTSAIPSGIMSVRSASYTGLVFIMLTHIIYTAYEMTTYKHYRPLLGLFQPTFAVGMIGLFLSNYDPEKGLTGTHFFILVIFANAMIAFTANVVMQWREGKSLEGKQE